MMLNWILYKELQNFVGTLALSVNNEFLKKKNGWRWEGGSEPSKSYILSRNTAVENSQAVQDSYLFQIDLLPPDPCFWVEQ